MALLSVEKLGKRISAECSLVDISLSVNAGERIALAGRNGAGKTSLLNILVGKDRADSGEIHRAKDLHIDYVEQELDRFDSLTLLEFVSDARADLKVLESNLRKLENLLAESPTDEALTRRYDQAQRRFESDGGFEFQTELEITLAALGFERARWEASLRSFSGGERNRAALARALLGRGRLLFLDEPTNHLDIQSTVWLEGILKETDRAYVVVSHDRTFLNNIIEKVWDLAFGALDIYPGNFDSYVSQSVERRLQRERNFQRQKEFIAKTEAFIRKNLAGQKTKQAQSRRKQLAKLKRIEAPKNELRTARMSVATAARSFSHILELSKLSVGYGDTPLIECAEMNLYRGETVGLIGPNGSGKSTLVRTIMGALEPLSGSARIGSKVEVGYFDQTLANVESDLEVIEHLWAVDPQADQRTLRSYLARFGFYGDETLKKAGKLSGGEKTKLSLALLMYQPSNFLIFDEPTNHLDMHSREALQSALAEFSGAALIVSHDRYFLNQVTEKTFAIENSRLHEYAGPYDYYVTKRAEREAQAPEASANKGSDYQSFKERSRRLSQLEKKIKSVTGKITDHEQELKALDSELAGGIDKSDWEKLSDTQVRKTEIEMNLLELYQQNEDAKCDLEREETSQ